jgi:glycosyltransferase involved in cell wall biosynthesis/predicted Zn-dependent protease
VSPVLRFAFGPLPPHFTPDIVQGVRHAGACLPFGPEGPVDLSITPDASWDDLVVAAPPGAAPECLVLWLSPGRVPPRLWEAPVPIVGLAPHWAAHWHWHRTALKRCDLVLTDRPGVERLRAEGIGHARPAVLCGLPPAMTYKDFWPERPRDIDVLFVGDLSPTAGRECLRSLGRLGRLAPRRRVVIRPAAPKSEYLDLLGRARIVFDHSPLGAIGRRAFEAVAAGALLLHNAGSAELDALLTPGAEYVAYRGHDLEDLAEHYLTHGEEREAIAGRAWSRVAEFSFDALLGKALTAVQEELGALRGRLPARVKPAPADGFAETVWAALSGGPAQALADALAAEAGSARAAVATGVLATTPAEAADRFRAALTADPSHAVAALNLAEALLDGGKPGEAAESARHALTTLEDPGLREDHLDAPHYGKGYDPFRAAWERAARDHAGDRRAELAAKRDLLRWRLHALLAELNRDLTHFEAATAARPDLPGAAAALGCALARAGHFAEAVPHLRAAVEADPFDIQAARALFHALGDAGDWAGRRAFTCERAALARSAPEAVPVEDWFAAAPVPPAAPGVPLAVAWEGEFRAAHSFANVNRHLSAGLLTRGHALALLPTDPPDLPAAPDPLSPDLERQIAAEAPAEVQVFVSHRWPPRERPPEAGHWVVMQPWEYGPAPAAWKPWLDAADEVWVPSAAVRRGFLESGVPADRVHIVPLGADPALFRPDAPPFPLATAKRFKFLFVGGTVPREGFDALLDAYGRAFTAGDDVCLVVKDSGVGTFYRNQTAGGLIAEFRNRPGAPKVEYLVRDLTEAELAGLYAACDCVALPYRAEGFALAAAEAMVAGRPVIATGAGPVPEYADPSTAYFVPATVTPLPREQLGGLAPAGEPSVFEPDRAALAALLRHVFEHPEEARAKGATARQVALTSLGWEHAVARAEERLRAVLARPVRRHSAEVKAQPKVSLCMIVRDEERNLPDCLGPVAGLFAETVVVDTGSRDRTARLAAALGARVFAFPWKDDFAAARNETLRHATGEWVFWLDADDRLDPASVGKLRALLAGLPDGNSAYVMKCVCVPEAPGGTATVVDHVRLFRNDPRHRWDFRVHEQILPALRATGADVRWSDVVITHLGYADPALRRRKLGRDLAILRSESAARPDDPFVLFNLGSVLSESGSPGEALPHLRRSLGLSDPAASIVRKLYALLSQCHQELGQPGEAIAACRAGRRLYPDDEELLLAESNLRRAGGDAAGAEACLRRLLGGAEGEHFGSVPVGLRGFRARHNLAALCLEQGRYGEAEAQWVSALVEQPAFFPAWVGLGELYLRAQEWPKLERHAAELEQLHEAGAEAALRLLGKALLRRGEFGAARAHFRAACRRFPRSVALRVLHSHACLKEGLDDDAAEAALRAVLELEPNHDEARHNLAVIRAKRTG